jgi:radical SAM protein with 4Fe4S-binding SPASM domain
MNTEFIAPAVLSDSPLWDRLDEKRIPFSFEIEITARCNHNCRHCYINLPAENQAVKKMELSVAKLSQLADQAAKLGALWCLITGGEPLLRRDFREIYMMLKKKGLLISIFTNASLLNPQHVELFKRYPPRDIEITVYGVTQATYEKVTRRPGSYSAFRRGLDLLLTNGINVRLKAMAMRSNLHELSAIAAFCREHTKDYFRFDPQLHLRFDGNVARNKEIVAERLSPAEIVALEQADEERADVLQKNCEHFIFPGSEHVECRHLFHCGAGKSSFSISYDGFFRLCSSLWHPDCIMDLKNHTLTTAWNQLVPKVRTRVSSDPEFLTKCRGCPIINLCLWCPAHAHLEHGRLDAWDAYFCQVAHARAAAIESKIESGKHSGG